MNITQPVQPDVTGMFRLSPRKPAVRFGPRQSVLMASDLCTTSYPLEWNRVAELVTENDRYALKNIGGVVSRTTRSFLTLIRASNGQHISLEPLIETFRRPTKTRSGYWYYSCRGIGSWQHEDAKLAFGLALEGILNHFAQLDAKQDVAA